MMTVLILYNRILGFSEHAIETKYGCMKVFSSKTFILEVRPALEFKLKKTKNDSILARQQVYAN